MINKGLATAKEEEVYGYHYRKMNIRNVFYHIKHLFFNEFMVEIGRKEKIILNKIDFEEMDSLIRRFYIWLTGKVNFFEFIDES